eukprot:scaffold7041_cov123-Chaetoceros_neogracile.AAC.1
MMNGEATGKGLDIKGKSAKCGNLPGFIPFLQIYRNDHKAMVSWPPSNGRIRVFYKNFQLRATAVTALRTTATEMQATNIGSAQLEHDRLRKCCRRWNVFVEDFNNSELSESGIVLDDPERIFFRTYITNQNISHIDTAYTTGRSSEPAFQDMNFSLLEAATSKDVDHKQLSIKLPLKSSLFSQSCDRV